MEIPIKHHLGVNELSVLVNIYSIMSSQNSSVGTVPVLDTRVADSRPIKGIVGFCLLCLCFSCFFLFLQLISLKYNSNKLILSLFFTIIFSYFLSYFILSYLILYYLIFCYLDNKIIIIIIYNNIFVNNLYRIVPGRPPLKS